MSTLRSRPRLSPALSAAIAIVSLFASSADSQVVHHPGTNRKIAQISGDLDKTLLKPTLTQTFSLAHASAMDLGIAFEHKGRCYFFFGDTKGGSAPSQDAFGYTTATNPEAVTLTIPLGPDGRFLPLVVPTIPNGAYRVPTGAVSHNNSTIYMVFSTDWSAGNGNMERSVMAKSTNDGLSWTYLFTLSEDVNHDMTNQHFINVSLSIENSADWPGLPYEGDNLVLFGSGAYRKSPVYLAAMPIDSIANPATLRYFTGLSAGNPVWGTSQAAAVPVVNEPVVGELSAAWIPQLSKWVLLYNGPSHETIFETGGIIMRTADLPWGPWSEREVIFDPWRDDGYGRFMHVPKTFIPMDDFGEGDKFGGAYGPYLIQRFITGDATATKLYFTMSTWNPYESIIMRSQVGAPPPPPPPASASVLTTPGDVTWTKSAGVWFLPYTIGSTPWISTFANSNSTKGLMYRWLPRDAWNTRLSFSVSGGKSEVLLLEGGGEIPVSGPVNNGLYDLIKAGWYGKVVQATWGHNDNAVDIAVGWDLRPFDSANLKVVVIDHRAANWGFVDVSRMTVARNVPAP